MADRHDRLVGPIRPPSIIRDVSHFGEIKLAKDLQVGETVLVQLSPEGWAWAMLVPTDPSVECAVATISRSPQRSTNETYTLGILIHGDSFTSEIKDETSVLLVSPHHPVCDDCKQPWPCRDRRLTIQARQLTRDLDDVCAHCGEQINGAWYEVYFDGMVSRRYHTAQKYKANGTKCVDALAELKRGVVEHPSDKTADDA